MVLHGVAWCCMVLHGIAWYCMALHGTAWNCMVFFYFQYISKGEGLAFSMTDITTKNRECRIF